ncbi:LysR family transcriptional regulator [Arthrobacter sp. 35W]|uniref:LysR family transcriptional regulator n=1 Tax=Arthrobacter sp. 35W TaxID=1132441 RepID=UPI00047C8A9B|nr:LysR family transcriptional regulator [Arthrobacter sp. 35W]
METRRLELLLELSRVGSMRGAAEVLGTTTSTVSQQIAMLTREIGTPVVEPAGRGVRLTPAGRRLAEHARTILAAVEAARADLDPDGEPAGTVRVAGFATAIRRNLMPIVAELATSHPEVQVVVNEHEPAEALAQLADGRIDLALTYDYNLAPAASDAGLDSLPLWSTPWSVAVPSHQDGIARGDALTVFNGFRGHDWIGNSRNRADEDVLRVIGSMAGYEPHVRHQADSLDLVEDLILAGMGIGLLPADRPTQPGITLVPLTKPDVRLRAYACTRRGRGTWPPLQLVLDRLAAGSGRSPYPPV